MKYSKLLLVKFFESLEVYVYILLKNIKLNITKYKNIVTPKYLEWYSPFCDLECTIQVCRGERFNR